MWRADKLKLPGEGEALPGRTASMPVAAAHLVSGAPMQGPWPGGEQAMFGMGCFWGAERMFWRQRGVLCTAAGYAGGLTPNPTYHEVCSGRTGHTEVVLVVFDPAQIAYQDLLRAFWEGHDPTQGMGQGNDVGTQYRSAVYCFGDAQLRAAEASRETYQRELDAARLGRITSELRAAPPFYFAEDDHQQYLHKNPQGYCGLGGTGVSCPVGVKRA